ncbi:MAG: globin, partial [Terriglobales bacterium]
LYPDDLGPAKEHLTLFLIQRTGGRTTYSDQRGHPRMRARHMPFKIGTAEKDAWLRNMKAALDSVPEFAPDKKLFFEFLENFAAFLVNQPD